MVLSLDFHLSAYIFVHLFLQAVYLTVLSILIMVVLNSQSKAKTMPCLLLIFALSTHVVFFAS